MKLQADRTLGPTITGYGEGWIAVNGEQVRTSVLISSMGHRLDWHSMRFEDLGPEHFSTMLNWGAELVLFGSGSHFRRPKHEWLAALYENRIGVETMDTQAACRTYNFLAGEGRKVVAALMV
ncbi:MAG: Mth938-like domain-containing protein [Betaproteobacteria bacterium]